MTIEITPDAGVPITPEPKIVDLHERVQAAAATADLLEEHGLDTTPNAEDKDVAAGLTGAYASNPEVTSKTVNNSRAATITPAAMQITRGILDEFSHAVVTNATEIRRLVTNKLILESENADPRIRIRALELLGKITDVGLFTEKTEVTITHQSTEELRKSLREKFNRILSRTHGQEEEEEVPSEVVIEGEVINVDDELGLKPEENVEIAPEVDEKTAETTLKEPERTETPLETPIDYDDILDDWEKP